MKFKPLRDRVLVKRIEDKEQKQNMVVRRLLFSRPLGRRSGPQHSNRSSGEG